MKVWELIAALSECKANADVCVENTHVGDESVYGITSFKMAGEMPMLIISPEA